MQAKCYYIFMNNSISADEAFMRQAYITAARSKDTTKIGSILVQSGSVIASGYNGHPRKVVDSEERYKNRELKYRFVVHSELNCILQTARLGLRAEGSILFTMTHPCVDCAKAIAQINCAEVVVHKQFGELIHTEEWIKSIQFAKLIFNEVEIPVREYDKILGISTMLNGKMINV